MSDKEKQREPLPEIPFDSADWADFGWTNPTPMPTDPKALAEIDRKAEEMLRRVVDRDLHA